MSLATLGTPMAKKKGRPPTGRHDATAKIDAEVLRKAKHIAVTDGKTLAEYLTEVLEPIVERRLRQMAGEMVEKPDRRGN